MTYRFSIRMGFTVLTWACSGLAQSTLPPAPSRTVVDVSGSGGHFTEPGIAVDPHDPARIVAVYQGGAEVQGLGAAAYSTNGGRNFTEAHGTALTDWRVVGDVTVTFDNRGRAYWCYLVFDRLGTSSYWAHNATRNGIFVRRSEDGGRTWKKPIPVRAFPAQHETNIPFEDEPRIFADSGSTSPFAGNLYVGWVEWQIDRSIMLFSRSSDAGQTWSAPTRIDAHAGLPRDDNGALGGFMQAIAPDGALYVVWTDGSSIVLTESHDGGRTFHHPTTILQTPPSYFGLSGVSRANGFGQIALAARPDGSVDHLYVTWSDYRNGDVDVFLSISADRGLTWSAPSRVNDDALHDGTDQFFQSLAVDPLSGDVYVAFYDGRLDGQNRKFSMTLARSLDHGHSFSNYALTGTPFEGRGAFLGDYTSIVAYDHRVCAAWTETMPPERDPKTAALQRSPSHPSSPRTKVRVGCAAFAP